MPRVQTTPHHAKMKREKTSDHHRPFFTPAKMADSGVNSPLPSSSSLFKDISNFKTPKRSSSRPFQQAQTTPQFFTASKRTPSYSLSSASNRRRRPATSAARRLRAFELEQSQSSRKEQVKKERSMKSLATSLTAWLNFLFENPRSCGCNADDRGGDGERKVGKRESDNHSNGEVQSGAWRLPKRQREDDEPGEGSMGDFPRSKFVYLRDSLRDVCSFDDLKERMREYLSLDGCEEVFTTMTQVVKLGKIGVAVGYDLAGMFPVFSLFQCNDWFGVIIEKLRCFTYNNIDEGRLKMKAHCPIVTDVGMKGKAIKVLTCYNPVWLRIGLYIIFGGESLLPNEDSSSEQEVAFLRMVIEKQFFAHAGLAKAYAYNKLVDGLYRPGKCQSRLPIKYGIDGLDGGSPLLFNVQSHIKSSQQMLNDFLSSEVMHGEGNLLAHLTIVGYKVSYQQIPLIEYDFRVTDLFQDVQDGVRLCRAIQLLQQESSILMKVVLPSDTQKKKLANCGIALQYLEQAGVPLNDDEGTIIIAEDVANGDKELTLSLLWNMFIHLQLPLLVNKTVLSEEVNKICKAHTELLDFDCSTHLDMLLRWMKAICENYDMEMASLTSLVDGKAMWCLLDFYFRKELHCPCSMKDLNDRSKGSIVSMRDTTDAVHNFVLSQKLTTLLGNFPEVLRICDILEHNGVCNDRSVIILLVFLCSQLLVKKSKDQLNFHKLMGCRCQTPNRRRLSTSSEAATNKQMELSAEDAAKKFKAVKAWWQEMAKQNTKCIIKPAGIFPFSADKCSSQICEENAAVVIQSHFRRVIELKKYAEIRKATSCLQLHIHAWLIAKQMLRRNEIRTTVIQEKCKQFDSLSSKVAFMVDRHNFVKMRSAATFIQRAARNWISKRHLRRAISAAGGICSEVVNHGTQKSSLIENEAMVSTEVGQTDPQNEAAVKIQLAWKKFLASDYRQKQHLGAIIIQSHFRGWVQRKAFLNQKYAAVMIQSVLQSLRSFRDFHEYKAATRSAIVIQSHVRGWIARKGACRDRGCIILIQSHCRRWLARRDFLSRKQAALKIQRAFKAMTCLKAFYSCRCAAIEIQRFVRGRNVRTQLLGASSLKASASRVTVFSLGNRALSAELMLVLNAIVTLQRWWRKVIAFKSRTEAATVMQSYIRGCICRQKAKQYAHHAVVIQAHWKGYIARKHAKGKLLDLRLRIQNAAANVHDGMRIINRLIAALKELKSMKNVSGILHNCATLDMATTHSKKCCERLVDEGAIDILLYQIRSVTRSIPDQEILKHCLSTLRNLVRYPHLADSLLNHRGSVETILWELLRNKEEGYFISCELLKQLCTTPRGVASIRSLPSMLKRLHALTEDLTKKVNHEKRNHRGLAARDNTERRLREAMKLLNLVN